MASLAYFVILGMMSLKISAFVWTKSTLVCPGFCLAPAVITTTSASWQPSNPAEYMFTGWTKLAPWLKSIHSPLARSWFTSIRTISLATPLIIREKAKVLPTFPAPTIATLDLDICILPLLKDIQWDFHIKRLGLLFPSAQSANTLKIHCFSQYCKSPVKDFWNRYIVEWLMIKINNLFAFYALKMPMTFWSSIKSLWPTRTLNHRCCPNLSR